jgi:hypothetical protein
LYVVVNKKVVGLAPGLSCQTNWWNNKEHRSKCYNMYLCVCVVQMTGLWCILQIKPGKTYHQAFCHLSLFTQSILKLF